MPLEDYLVGLAFFAGTWAAVLAAAVLLVRRRLGHLAGAPRLLALAVLATGGIIAAHLLPGMLGVLSRWAALFTALVLLAVVSRVRAIRSRPEAARAPISESTWISRAAAAVAVVALALWVGAWAWIASVQPTMKIDTLTFHLPNIARWIQSETFWQVDQFVALLSHGNYPENGDVVFLSVVLPWENDAFVQLVNVPYLALCALAVYGIARELRAPSALAVLAGAVFTALPAMLFTAQGGAQTDLVMYSTLGSGILFLLRHSRTGRVSELALAGLALGLAFGTKWYGVSSVAVVLGVWAIAGLLARRGPSVVARQGAALTGLVALAGGFWLVRNWVVSSNPLYPVKVELAGLTLFDAPRDSIRECAGFTIANYLGESDVWRRYLWPAYEKWLGLPGLFIAAGLAAVVALALALRRSAASRGVPSGEVIALAGCAILLALAYSVTPYSALGGEDQPALAGFNTRYLVPAFVAAAPLVAWCAARIGRLRVALELLALAAVADGIRRGFDVPGSLVLKVGIALVLAVAAAWIAVAIARRVRPAIRLPVLAALAGIAIAAVVGLGYARQQDFNEGRYRGMEPAFDWVLRNAPAEHKIGLGGAWGIHGVAPVLPSFGPRLENDVAYVGETIRGQLGEYRTRERWAEAIRRGGFDLLIVGTKGYRPENTRKCYVPGAESDEHVWARAEGFPVLARSDRLTLYRVRTAG